MKFRKLSKCLQQMLALYSKWEVLNLHSLPHLLLKQVSTIGNSQNWTYHLTQSKRKILCHVSLSLHIIQTFRILPAASFSSLLFSPKQVQKTPMIMARKHGKTIKMVQTTKNTKRNILSGSDNWQKAAWQTAWSKLSPLLSVYCLHNSLP